MARLNGEGQIIEVHLCALILVLNITNSTQADVLHFVSIFFDLSVSELGTTARYNACSTDITFFDLLSGPDVFQFKVHFRRKRLSPALVDKKCMYHDLLVQDHWW